MNINTNLDVDAGCICIVDGEYINMHGGTDPRDDVLSLNLEPGRYQITYDLPDTWNDHLQGYCEIECTGELIIGDICYIFSNDDDEEDKWSALLDDTDYLRKMKKGKGHCIETGGDGAFEVDLTITRIK